MNIDKLREELAEDEGCKYEIYLDHLGLETFGIGHLVTIDDPEFGKPIGSPVTQERVQSVFRRDIAITQEDCNRMYDNFADLPEEAQLILANMMFNLGYSRMSKFKKLRAAVQENNWKECAAQMEDSKWYTQVPNRARRLITRMEEVA